MTRKYFGTDGIRGRVGAEPVTPEFMYRLARAAGGVLAATQRSMQSPDQSPAQPQDRPARVVIGRDTRGSGPLFEAAIQTGLLAAGLDVVLLGVVPTPAVAYLTRTLEATAGVVITASHNPHADNGIKFFSAGGHKLPDEIELAIEAAIATAEEAGFAPPSADRPVQVEHLADATARYVRYCRENFPAGLSLAGLKLVVDCANGATFEAAPQVLESLGADVQVLACAPDGLNINRACGSTHLAALQQAVVERQADLGIAFDGDGDRVIMVDHQGQEVDGDELLFIIAMHRHRQQPLAGVVGTQMSNLGMEKALRDAGMGFERARVGDRFVLERMQALGWDLGGESSGHIICRDCGTTGDGIVSALQVLAAMVSSGSSLQALRSGMSRYPQHLINVRLPQRLDVLALPEVSRAVDAAEAELGDTGRVLLRNSGTEPLVRVMVEGEQAGQVEALAGRLAAVVEQAVAQR